MSIWSFDLGIDASWPEWFKKYREASDAELRSRIEAEMRGEMPREQFREWALVRARAHVRWLETLAPDQRVWIEEQERLDQHTVIPEGRKVDLEEFTRALGRRS